MEKFWILILIFSVALVALDLWIIISLKKAKRAGIELTPYFCFRRVLYIVKFCVCVLSIVLIFVDVFVGGLGKVPLMFVSFFLILGSVELLYEKKCRCGKKT